MHQLNPSIFSFSPDNPSPSTSTSCPINLLANHEKNQLFTEMQGTEEKIKKSYDTIFQSTTDDQRIQTLNYLKQACDKLIDQTMKLNRSIQNTNPNQILEYIENLPFYNETNPMNYVEKKRFVLIEEALANPCLIPAMPTQVIEYQLGVLWNAYKNKNLSNRMFYYLTLTRLEQVPSYLAFCQRDNMLFKSSCAEICEFNR